MEDEALIVLGESPHELTPEILAMIEQYPGTEFDLPISKKMVDIYQTQP